MAHNNWCSSGKSSMEASSATTISKGSGCSRLNFERPATGFSFSKRWTVCPSKAVKCCNTRSLPASKLPNARCSERVMWAAAFPVGAVSAMRGISAASAHSSASSLATVVVLPVPGPPVTSISGCNTASAAASRCPLCPASGNQSRKRCCSPIFSGSPTRLRAIRRNSAATLRSNANSLPPNSRRPRNTKGVNALPSPTTGAACRNASASCGASVM